MRQEQQQPVAQRGGGAFKNHCAHRMRMEEEKKMDEDSSAATTSMTAAGLYSSSLSLVVTNASAVAASPFATTPTNASQQLRLPTVVTPDSTCQPRGARVSTRRRPRVVQSQQQQHQQQQNHYSSRKQQQQQQQKLSMPLGIVIGLMMLLCVWIVTNAMVLAIHSNGNLQQSNTNNQQQSNDQPQQQLPSWTNPNYDVVHVVQTRFMQLQPHLLHLGQARLRLFETLTVPSMAHQTEQSFLWIIRTDPDLDSSIRTPLIQLLKDLPVNVLLVASNENPEGFREGHCVADITADTVWVGSWPLLQSYHEAAATHTLLETRLDADDAVAVDFVELVQTNAAVVAAEAQPPNRGHFWRVWCAENHVEWQYDSPWSNNNSSSSSSTSPTETGALLGLRAGKCITPGLTWQYGVGVRRSQIPLSSKHHQIQKQVRACRDSSEDETNSHDDNADDSQCLSKLGGDLPLALRARTPTSAGMDHILVAHHTEKAFPMQQLQNSKWKDTQEALWESLPMLFGVRGPDLWSVRTFIHDHLAEIAQDALRGQCTKGHSCKQQSQAVLQELVAASSGRDDQGLEQAKPQQLPHQKHHHHDDTSEAVAASSS